MCHFDHEKLKKIRESLSNKIDKKNLNNESFFGLQLIKHFKMIKLSNKMEFNY